MSAASKGDGSPAVEYSPQAVEQLLQHLVSGMSVREIAKLPGMPALRTVWLWRHKYPEFKKAYTDAKLFGIEVMAEEIIDLADEVAAKKQHVMKARLQIDVRKFVLIKLLPHVYGDALEVKHSGSVNVTIKRFTPEDPPAGA